MNRSRVAVLLVTAFAIVTLGVAASTLESAPVSGPQRVDAPGTATDSSAGGEQSGRKVSESEGQSMDHLVLPDLSVADGRGDASDRAGRPLERAALGIALVVVGATVAVWWLTRGASPSEGSADDGTSDATRRTGPSRSRVAAGNAPPTNDVYRAWRAMVTSFGIEPDDQDTPAELAQKAVSAGLPEEPVDDLTGVFRAVRYGGESPTEEDETRARSALRAIRRTVRSNDAESPSSET